MSIIIPVVVDEATSPSQPGTRDLVHYGKFFSATRLKAGSDEEMSLRVFLWLAKTRAALGLFFSHKETQEVIKNYEDGLRFFVSLRVFCGQQNSSCANTKRWQEPKIDNLKPRLV